MSVNSRTFSPVGSSTSANGRAAVAAGADSSRREYVGTPASGARLFGLRPLPVPSRPRSTLPGKCTDRAVPVELLQRVRAAARRHGAPAVVPSGTSMRRKQSTTGVTREVVSVLVAGDGRRGACSNFEGTRPASIPHRTSHIAGRNIVMVVQFSACYGAGKAKELTGLTMTERNVGRSARRLVLGVKVVHVDIFDAWRFNR